MRHGVVDLLIFNLRRERPMILNMPLDAVSRRYADRLYQESLEKILSTQQRELLEVNQDFAARNITQSGGYFTAQATVLIRNAEHLAEARVDSLLRAYEKSGSTLDDAAMQESPPRQRNFVSDTARTLSKRCKIKLDKHLAGKSPVGSEKRLLTKSSTE